MVNHRSLWFCENWFPYFRPKGGRGGSQGSSNARWWLEGLTTAGSAVQSRGFTRRRRGGGREGRGQSEAGSPGPRSPRSPRGRPRAGRGGAGGGNLESCFVPPPSHATLPRGGRDHPASTRGHAPAAPSWRRGSLSPDGQAPGRGPRRSRARAAVGAAPAATRVGFAAQAPAKEASVSGSSLAKRSAAIVAVRMMRSSVCRHRTILSRLSCGVPPPGKQSGAGAEGPTRPVSRRPRRPEPGGPAKQVKKSERKRPVLPLTREVHEGTGQHQASASRCCHSSRGRLPTGAAPPGSKGPGWPLLLVLERRAGKPEKHTPPVWASHPPAS